MDINTEKKEILRKRFIDYTNKSVRSQECHDDIGVMVYPVLWEKYEGMKTSINAVIEEIRTDSDYLHDKPKSELPVIFFSVAGFNGSKELQNVTEHTGLIVIDIDVKDNPDTDFNQLRKKFSWNRYVYACFRSPSGGIKVVYNTNIKDIKHHKVYFHALFKHVSTGYPEIFKIDTSGSNMNRACYMPYDTNVYFNSCSYRYCLSDQQITELSDEIKSKKLYTKSLKPLLEVDDYSFDDHYNNILNLLKNQTSVGIEENQSSSSSNSSIENQTSVGLYDNIFNNYRFNNIDYIMSTDVCFFEIILRKNSYPCKLDYETFLDEHYFPNSTQQPISIDDTIGFEETDGIDYCEVKNLEDGIRVGYRHRTLASMSMKFIFNNPFCHPKVLVEHMQHLNHKHCLDPQPDKNPKPSDEEVKNIVLYNYQKFITGELDFNKAIRKNHRNTGIMKKYVFRSRKYIKLYNSYTKHRGDDCFAKGRRAKNVGKYSEAIKTLQNGSKITYKLIANELGMSERNLLRIRSDENFKEFFEQQNSLIKNYNTSIKKNNVDDDVLDVGAEILENHKNILAKENPQKEVTENVCLTDEQKSSLYNRIYSNVLNKLGDDESDELFKLFQKNLEELKPDERKILNMETDSISDADTFWKQGNLELKLLRLHDEVSSANKVI